jgi:hypothetical protein
VSGRAPSFHADPGEAEQLLALTEHGKQDLARLVLRLERERDELAAALRRVQELAAALRRVQQWFKYPKMDDRPTEVIKAALKRVEEGL